MPRMYKGKGGGLVLAYDVFVFVEFSVLYLDKLLLGFVLFALRGMSPQFWL